MGDNNKKGIHVSFLVTAHQMLNFGLSLFCKPERLKRPKKEEINSSRFKLKFGVKQASAASLYEDVQEMEIDAAGIENPDVCPNLSTNYYICAWTHYTSTTC